MYNNPQEEKIPIVKEISFYFPKDKEGLFEVKDRIVIDKSLKDLVENSDLFDEKAKSRFLFE